MIKRRQIAIATISTLIAAPIVIASANALSSCAFNGKGSDETKGVDISTRDVEVDHNSGVGTFDVFLNEQPIDNGAYIFINTAEGPHHVELLDPQEDVYHGHPAVLYDVHDGKATVRICFTEFVGETTKTVVSIYVKYNSRSGDWVTKRIDNINLTTTYIHNPQEEVHIICLNDLHGAAEGYGEPKEDFPATNIKNPGVIRLMNQISPIIDSHPGSFLVTAGDNNSGDMFSSSVHGESIYKVLKSMGARYSAVGNHAFEWGITPMATYQFDNWARTKDTMGNYFISSNILNGKLDQKKKWVSNPEKDGFAEDFAFWLSQKVGWADPYKIVNMNGHLVCLIGLTTDGALKDGNKSVVDNLSFIDCNAAVNYSIYLCKQEIEHQLFDSIESFVLLTHVESEMTPDGKVVGKAAELAASVENEKIDAVISAHSHKTVNGSVYNLNFGKNVLVGQAETEGRKYLDLTFRFDNTKPMGQKKISVTQDVKDMTLTFGEGEEGYQRAVRDLEKQKDNPTTQTVKNVITSFNYEKNKMLDKLKDEIAERNDSLLYPASQVPGGIGHAYYINQRRYDGKVPNEGGYIIDQLGAWVNYACIGGFVDYNRDDIEASSAGLNYPAISMINQDSMRVQFNKPQSEKDHKVTLKDMYSIQTYENTTIFGYLSIWQLANMINHSLAGDGKFNYSAPEHNYYTPETAETSLNNLTRFNDEYNADGTVKHQQTDLCDSKEFPHEDEYKKLKNCYCLYNCGPIQSYGFTFGVERAASGSQKDDAGRTWRLRLVPNTDDSTNEDIPNWPDIHILDPRYQEEGKADAEIYSTIQNPGKWLSAQEWYKKYGPMIPMITNDFLYNGANWETPMAAVYMKHNEGLSWRDYPVIKFSQITRDLLIRFCHLSQTKYATLFPFDMPIDIVKQIVTYPET